MRANYYGQLPARGVAWVATLSRLDAEAGWRSGKYSRESLMRTRLSSGKAAPLFSTLRYVGIGGRESSVYICVCI